MRPYYVLSVDGAAPAIATAGDFGGASETDRAAVDRLEIGDVHRADGWTATRCRPGILWAAMGLDPSGDAATLAVSYLRLAATVSRIR